MQVGDWVYLTEDNPDGIRYGRQGCLVKITAVSTVIDHDWTYKFEDRVSSAPERILQLAKVQEVYLLLTSERGRRGWGKTYVRKYVDLASYREESDYYEGSADYLVLAKKKLVIPYVDPNEVVVEEVPVVAQPVPNPAMFVARGDWARPANFGDVGFAPAQWGIPDEAEMAGIRRMVERRNQGQNNE